tara:strand:- start:14463 stop:15467 length:1005 start_codon:yes stop_codon:yes gene_type:complete
MAVDIIKEKVAEIDFDTSHGFKTAICVLAYNRPDYFKEVVESIEANTESHELPVFFFLDGGPNSTTKENIEIIKSCKKIKNKFVIAREGNIGCSKNLIDARRFVFDKMGFDLAFIFEDDLVVSENYVRLLLNAYKDLSEKYENIGMLQAWNLDEDANVENPDEEKLSSFRVIEDTHLWGYLMPRKAWDQIKERMYEYEKTFHDPLPKNGMGKIVFESNLGAVRKFMHESWSEPPSQEGNPSIIVDPFIEKKKGRFFGPNAPTGQDINTELNLSSKGLVRLVACQNRSRYIGKIGLHATQAIWDKWGFGTIRLVNHRSDKLVERFSVVGDTARNE